MDHGLWYTILAITIKTIHASRRLYNEAMKYSKLPAGQSNVVFESHSFERAPYDKMDGEYLAEYYER